MSSALYADKIALIMRVKDFLLDGKAYLTGTCGLILALLTERAEPSPELLASALNVLVPNDVDFVFTSKDPAEFEAFVKAMMRDVEPSTNAKMAAFSYLFYGADGTHEVTPFDTGLSKEGAKFLQGLWLDKAFLHTLPAQLVLSSKCTTLRKLAVGTIEVDIRFSTDDRKPLRRMYDALDLDVTTLRAEVDPREVSAVWDLKKAFVAYYSGLRPLAKDRSLKRGLDALESSASCLFDADCFDDKVVDFVASKREVLSLIAKCFRTVGTPGQKIAVMLTKKA